MGEFLQTWGPWIFLAGVFAAMHWFGFCFCSARRHCHKSAPDGEATPGNPKAAAKEKAAGTHH